MYAATLKCMFRSIPSFIAIAVVLMANWAQAAPKEVVLYYFKGGADGFGPAAGLIADNAGNLYGTTQYGGGGVCQNVLNGPVLGCGTVFRLSPPTKPGDVWTEAVL